MVVITGICLVVQADVVRYRPLLLVLAAGKTASSLAALGFYLFDQDVFIYLLNFLVDGFLAVVALLSGRWPAGSESPPLRPEGARRGWGPPSCYADCPASCACAFAEAMAPGLRGAAAGRQRRRLPHSRRRTRSRSRSRSTATWRACPGAA